MLLDQNALALAFKSLCQPVLWSSQAPLQLEPPPSESASALENILLRSSAQKRTPCGTGCLQADLSHHEGHGTVGSSTP